MSLHAVVEVAFQVHNFRNVDLFHQGLYRLHFQAYQETPLETDRSSGGLALVPLGTNAASLERAALQQQNSSGANFLGAVGSDSAQQLNSSSLAAGGGKVASSAAGGTSTGANGVVVAGRKFNAEEASSRAAGADAASSKEKYPLEKRAPAAPDQQADDCHVAYATPVRCLSSPAAIPPALSRTSSGAYVPRGEVFAGEKWGDINS